MKGNTLIGKGTFSTVYRKGSSKKVTVLSNDPVKECMSLGWFPKTRLFPKVERCFHPGTRQAYSMKFYSKVRAPKRELNARSYELYRVLKELVDDYGYSRSLTPYEQWSAAFNTLPAKFSREKAHLLAALDALSNYGSDACFEISPRNIAKTASGKLVLLDCFFMRSALTATFSK